MAIPPQCLFPPTRSARSRGTAETRGHGILAGCALVVVQSLWGEPVFLLGMVSVSVTVLCQLVNLPIEFYASKRARHLLVHAGMVTAAEAPVVQRVLHAAAMTYVAATLTAVLTWLYCCIRAGLLGGSRSQCSPGRLSHRKDNTQ